MSERLTPFERKLWRGDKPIHPSVLKNCKDRLTQLEATLQAKDAEITTLVEALELIIAIEPADPRRHKLTLVQDIARLAIKEVTNG